MDLRVDLNRSPGDIVKFKARVNLVDIFKNALKGSDSTSSQSEKPVQRFRSTLKYGEVVTNEDVLHRLEERDNAKKRKDEDILQRKIARSEKNEAARKRHLQPPKTAPPAKKTTNSAVEKTDKEVVASSLGSSDKKEVVVGEDFVEVKYMMESRKSKDKNFIAKVIKVKNGKFVGNFLRRTGSNSKGEIYTYPVIKDIFSFTFEQIVRVLEKPSFGRRGKLHFNL